ncbi:MAG: threonine aldolase family protein [Thermaurantimonas sp.]|uniref:threonine aldolase family protein n=1 Tax=Thermaurantimonas sp. TaxID=2681568 RepID=UPI003919472A
MIRKVDLRSDTVTRPTPSMLQAMMKADVGDDVIDKDPTTQKLEEMAASIWGFDAALFCPSGTMCNQIAIMVHTKPGDEVICHRLSHIYWYEGGGIAANALCSVRLLDGENGIISPESLAYNINSVDEHHAHSALLSLENTVNKAGGTCYTAAQIRTLAEEGQRLGLKVHLDGARIYNALIYNNEQPADYHRSVDSMSICLSKGLGCPVGSLLLGSADFIVKAKRIRKRLGGGMRQSGFLAAAGIYALQNHIHRLADDHARARKLADGLRVSSWVSEVVSPQTNIVIFKTKKNPSEVAEKLEMHGIRLIHMCQGWLRLVTHLDISDDDIEYCLTIFRSMEK